MMGHYRAQRPTNGILPVRVSRFSSLAPTFPQAGGAAPAEGRGRLCAPDVSHRHGPRAVAARLRDSSGRRAAPLLSLTPLHTQAHPRRKFVRDATSGPSARRRRERARRCEATLFPPPSPRHHSPSASSERGLACALPARRRGPGKGRGSEARRRGCEG